MCPICWINGLIALLISVGILSIDSPYTPYLIGIAIILTAYSMWKFWKGYKKWQNFSAEQRARNWKTIKRFTLPHIKNHTLSTHSEKQKQKHT